MRITKVRVGVVVLCIALATSGSTAGALANSDAEHDDIVIDEGGAAIRTDSPPGVDYKSTLTPAQQADELLAEAPELVSLLAPNPYPPDSPEAMAYDLTLLEQGYTQAIAIAPLRDAATGTFMDCGWVTCSVWWSWSRTLWLNEKMNGTSPDSRLIIAGAIGAALCSFAGPAASVCAGAVMLRWRSLADHIKHAVSTRTCSRWIINRPYTVFVYPGIPVITIVGYNRWLNHDGAVCQAPKDVVK